MKTKKPAAAASAGSLVLEITTDTTSVEGDARAGAAALLAFAASLRKSRLEAKRKRAAELAKKRMR
jgi:hypothetical protein